MPRYSETHFNANEIQIGILIASFSFFQFLFAPILGRLSDRVGRKPVISFALLLSAISYFIFAFAPNYFIALLSRCIGGIGGGSISAAQAYIADITPKSERAKGMGLIGTAFGLGFVLGPFIGGLLSTYGYRVPNISAGAFSFLAFLLTQVYLSESLKSKVEAKIKRSDLLYSLNLSRFKNSFSKPDTGKFLIIFFLITFSIANTYGVIPIFAYRYLSFSDKQIGYIYAVIGLVGVLVQGYFIGKLTKKFGEKKLLNIGMILMLSGLALIPVSIYSIIIIWMLVLAMSTGLALVNPTILSIISKLTSPDEQGEVLGVNQSMGSLGRVLGPLWGGFAFNILGYQFPFWTASFFTTIAFIIAFNFFKMVKLNL